MRALVLGGAGAVCKETTKDLSSYSQFDQIVVADNNYPAAASLVESLGNRRVTALSFDARDEKGMRRLFPQYDIVVNGLPFQFDYAVNKACVDAGVSGLDLSSEDPQFDLHEQALERDMLFVPGVGATPGITNMMVRRAADILEELTTVEIYFAAFRALAPAPGLLQTTLWEFNPEVSERSAVYYERGKWHATPPLSGGLAVRFHDQIGEQMVYYVPHDEANTLPASYPSLERAAVRGCFPPQVMGLMKALAKAGLLSESPVSLNGKEIPAIEAVRALLSSSPTSRENPVWAYGLVVEVVGKRAGRRVRCTYRNNHPPQDEWGGQAAYYKNVGVPLSIGAQLIASGELPARGVLPPEQAFSPDPFFRELARRGITVEESILDEGILSPHPNTD